MKLYALLAFCLFTVSAINLYSQDAKPSRQLSQPVMMALPQATATKDPVSLFNEDLNVQAAYTAINKVLADRKLEVRDIRQALANVDKMRAKIPSFANDPNAFIAANSGADVYLEFSVELIKDGGTSKIRINLASKESATAKLLGSNSGTSKAIATNDISTLTEMALNSCIETVMQQIRGYWTDMPKNGKPIIVTISSQNIDLNQPTPNGKRIDRELTKLLKENTVSYRRDQSTAKNMIFNPVYVDIVKYDDIIEFSYLVEDLFKTFEVKYNTEVEGKSIEITVTQ